MIQNNLPPDSQQWARNIESRLKSTERELSNNSARDSASRATLSGVQVSVNALSLQAAAHTIQQRSSRNYNFTVPNPGFSATQDVLVDAFTITVPPYAYVFTTLTGRAYYTLSGYTGALPKNQSLSLIGKIQDASNGVISKVPVTHIPDTAVSGTGYPYEAEFFVRLPDPNVGTTGTEFSDTFRYELYIRFSGAGSGGGTINVFGNTSAVFETSFADPSTYVPLEN